MTKLLKRGISVVLAGILFVQSPYLTASVYAQDMPDDILEEEYISLDPETEIVYEDESLPGAAPFTERSAGTQSNFQISGTDSISELFSDAISEEMEAGNQSGHTDGYNVFGIKMNGKNAVVDMESAEMDSTLVVALYEEDGNKMLASGTATVSAGDRTANVVIDIDTMPQYYILRAYLVEPDTLAPLSTEYESRDYTREMQKFFSKTTSDFDPQAVVNFDEDIKDNFAVYREDMHRILENHEANILLEQETGSEKQYIFTNISEEISGLKSGDRFSYEFSDGKYLCGIIDQIVCDGQNATITLADDVELSDIFEYVKIDLDFGETNNSDDNVERELSCVEEIAHEMASDEDSAKLDLFFDFPEIKAYGISATGSGHLTGEINIYKDRSMDFTDIRVSLTPKFDLKIGVEGKIKWRSDPKIVGPWYLPFGLSITMETSLYVNADASVTFTTSVYQKFYWEISSDNGFKKNYSDPKFDPTFEQTTKAELDVEVGAEFAPTVAWLQVVILDQSHAAAKFQIPFRVGLHIKAALPITHYNSKYPYLHDCKLCLDGYLAPFIAIDLPRLFIFDEEYKLKPINIDDSEMVRKEFNKMYWYFSVDHKEFKFDATCPYKSWKVTATVKDNKTDMHPIKNAILKCEPQKMKVLTYGEHNYEESMSVAQCTTDDNGEAVFYLPDGEYMLSIEADGYENLKTLLHVAANTRVVNYKLNKNKPDEDAEKAVYKQSFSVLDQKDGKPIEGVKITSSVGFYLAADKSGGRIMSLTTDKNGYSEAWMEEGKHFLGFEAEKYNTISNMEYEKDSRDGDTLTTHMILKDDGDEDPTPTPPPTYSQVIDIEMGNNVSAAITGDGRLWMWGVDDYGQLGLGENPPSWTIVHPMPVMDNVIDVALGNSHSGAVTKDGKLWMWGKNNYGEVGEPATGSAFAPVYSPVNIMDDVAKVSLGDGGSAAIKTDGSLWLWGGNNEDVNGYSIRADSHVPVKVMDDVIDVSIGKSGSQKFNYAAVKKDGSLWVWGNDYIGNGKRGKSVDPVKVEEITKAKQVNLGRDGGAVLTSDGELYTWGVDSSGQLGNGSDRINAGLSPEKVMDNVIKMDYSDAYRCGGVKKDGSLWTWGNNNEGELGNSEYNVQFNSKPVKVKTDVKNVSMGYYHSGLIDDNGELWLWGGGFALGRERKLDENNYEIYTTVPEKINLTEAVDSTAADAALNSGQYITVNLEPLLLSAEKAFLPLTVYNVYAMRNREDEAPLSSGNLLYIDQRMTDNNGYLDMTCYPKEIMENAAIFAVKIKDFTTDDEDPGDVLDEDIPEGGIKDIPSDQLWIAGIKDLTYDGTKQIQEFRIYDGKKLLVEKADYTVSYKNNKDVFNFEDADKLSDSERKKAPQMILKMKGNYSGSETIYFRIMPKPDDSGEGSTVSKISMSKVTVSAIPVQNYIGKDYTVNDLKAKDGVTKLPFTVSYTKGNTATLTPGVDYEVRIINGRKAGTATLILKGKDAGGTSGALENSFIGEKRVKFKIAARSIDDPMIRITGNGIDGALTAVYEKSGAKPEFNVTYCGMTLKEGRDYVLKYSNNTNYVGTGAISDKTGVVTINGRGNFAKSKKLNFSITRREFSTEAGLTLVALDKTEGKSAGQFRTTVKVFDRGGKLLKAGTDYEKEIKYFQYGEELNKDSIPKASGKGDKPAEITVRVTGRGGYNGTMETTYRIIPQTVPVMDIDKAGFKINDQPYTGNAVRITNASQFSSTPVIGKGTVRKELIFGKDYMVLPESYVKNIDKGTASVTLIGIGDCTGAKTVRFKIGTRSIKDIWKEAKKGGENQ